MFLSPNGTSLQKSECRFTNKFALFLQPTPGVLWCYGAVGSGNGSYVEAETHR